jgi:CheY-like chemotaxis protein
VNILLVDDDPIFLKVLDRCLAERGHCLRLATSGPEALERMEEKIPDLVFSDIEMPGMDGIELLRQVGERFPGVPVVLLTAYGDAIHTASAFQYGARGYLQKPVRVEALLAGIQRLEDSILPGSQNC